MTDVLRFLSWYLIITLVGWAAFPLAYRFFSRLPDHGYALARALGWLVWGYLFWALGSLGFLQNDLGGELLALLVVVVLSAAAIWGKWGDLWGWVHSRARYILCAEAVFLAAFAFLAFIRAANPTIDGTEKPMELAFLNAILKSPTLPPHDPWLSGYAISYYYFGYVLVTMLIRLSAVGSGVGFNLAIALLFGLTAVGAYGILYDLLALRRPAGSTSQQNAPLGLPIFAPVFILLMGNLEGILAMLHDKGILWSEVNGVWQSSFWKWLGVLELKDPPVLPLSWMPHYSFIPWWRASRVLADYKLNGAFVEVIDEFPFFSYLLSDLHPHVLAMPFAVLMIGLGLNVWLSARETVSRWFGADLPFDRAGFILAGVLLGSLAFLNTWDFPIYVALVAGAYALGRMSEVGLRWSLLGDFLRLAALVGIAGAVFYLPFYVGFSSQAGGILPSMVFFTRGAQFWVMFATLLVPILVYLGYRLAHHEGNRPDFGRGFAVAIGLVGALWLAMIALGALASQLPSLGRLFMDNLGAGDASIGQVITASLVGFTTPDGAAFPGRLTAPGAWISLTIILGLVLAALIGFRRQPQEDLDAIAPAEIFEESIPAQPSLPRLDAFWLLLILVGALLVLAPEFFYLRDQFGARMNTIFKFYYGAWILWGIGAGYAVAVLLEDLGRISGLVWRVGVVCLLGIGLTYAGWGLWTKTGGFHPGEGWTLDGNAYLTLYAPDDVAAVRWLDQQPPGVIAEAMGDSYHSETSRLATLSGYSTVLGWFNHEYQWRGTTEVIGPRQPDLEELYTTNDWQTALDIIQHYQIRYIYIGPVERAKYQVNEGKFQRNLPAPFQAGQDTIYTVPQSAPLVGQAPWNGGEVK